MALLSIDRQLRLKTPNTTQIPNFKKELIWFAKPNLSLKYILDVSLKYHH